MDAGRSQSTGELELSSVVYDLFDRSPPPISPLSQVLNDSINDKINSTRGIENFFIQKIVKYNWFSKHFSIIFYIRYVGKVTKFGKNILNLLAILVVGSFARLVQNKK